MTPAKTPSNAPSDEPALSLVADIDRRLPRAYRSLTTARHGFTRCPSGNRRRECDEAEAQLNELLDLRLALVGVGDLVPAGI